jgi:hypothetical protein
VAARAPEWARPSGGLRLRAARRWACAIISKHAWDTPPGQCNRLNDEQEPQQPERIQSHAESSGLDGNAARAVFPSLSFRIWQQRGKDAPLDQISLRRARCPGDSWPCPSPLFQRPSISRATAPGRVLSRSWHAVDSCITMRRWAAGVARGRGHVPQRPFVLSFHPQDMCALPVQSQFQSGASGARAP